MNICVIRHGQTNFNVQGLCNDDPRTPVYLTEHGIEQAQTAAQALAQRTFDTIFVSELPRTQQTADIINQYHHLQIVQRRVLNDIHSGFDGQPVERYFAAVGKDRMNTVPLGGESLRQFQQRINRFIDELLVQAYQNVLVVAHEETLRIFAARFHNLDDEAMQALSFDNCEYLLFEDTGA